MKRPADERFTSLPEMKAVADANRENSVENVITNRHVRFTPHPANPTRGLTIEGSNGYIDPTHYSFGQLASLVSAPASYLRKLPAPLAADALNYGMQFHREVQEIGVLRTREQVETPDGDIGNHVELRAATGPNYGRVWNNDIIGMLMNKFGDGRTGDFRVPGEFGQDVPITKDNTTLYASDRDMFVFLADEHNRIEMSDRRDGKPGSLARGFFVWNSEVGSQSLGAAFFLFDFVCMNRIVWGVQEFKEIRLRHSSGAPDRWMENIVPVLKEYSNASAAPVEETIQIAQQKRVDDDLHKFLKDRKFTKAEINGAQEAHLREEGRPIESLWDAVTGVTAYAKSIKNQDDRVGVERKGGSLLDLAEW
tara:strand:+ start:8694 stop:9788 length:1095 start_codon:yes stop_codon:yes gene_type:complete